MIVKRFGKFSGVSLQKIATEEPYVLTNEKESACNQNVIVLVANGYAYNREL